MKLSQPELLSGSHKDTDLHRFIAIQTSFGFLTIVAAQVIRCNRIVTQYDLPQNQKLSVALLAV